jgi:O-antigen/teichoic acid export membrane protein
MIEQTMTDNKKERSFWGIFAESVVWNYATLVTDALGRIVTITLFTRAWSQETYGLWLTISSLATYVIVADVGMQSYVGNRLAQELGSGRYDQARKTFHTSLGLYLGLLVIFLLVVMPLLSILPFHDIWKVREIPLSTIRILIALILMQSSVTFVAKTIHLGLKATQRVDKAQQLQFLQKFVWLCLTILVLLLGGGPIMLAFALLVGVTALEVPWIIQLKKVAPFFFTIGVRAFDWQYAKSFFKPSVYFSLFQLGNLLLFQGDVLVIATMLGASAVTPYVVVRTVSLFIRQLVRGITANLIPRTAALYAVGAQKQLNILSSWAQRLAMLVGVPLAIVFIFFGADFMTIWVGDSIAWDPRTVWTFGLLAISSTLWIPASNIPFATNRQERFCTAFFIGSVLAVIMAFPLSKFLGGWGVALGLLLSDILINLWFVFEEATRILSLPLSRYLRATVQRGIVPTVVAIAVAIFIAQWQTRPIIRLLLGGVMTTLIFGGVSYCLMWSLQERRALSRFILRFSLS